MKTLILILMFILFSGFSYSEKSELSVNEINKIVNAIYKAENSRMHPYGIMRSYCLPDDPNGQCRKGCFQTVEKWGKTLDYKNIGDFIVKLSKIYCPLETYNGNNYNKTPNANWIKNVTFFYNQNKKGKGK